MTIGSRSLVSHPSTGTWNAKTIAIEIQYCAVRKMPVRSQHNSTSTVPTTAITVSTVYSGTWSSIGRPPPRPGGRRRARGGRLRTQPPKEPQDRADRLVRQQPAPRDDEEEDQFLQRHAPDELDARHVPR